MGSDSNASTSVSAFGRASASALALEDDVRDASDASAAAAISIGGGEGGGTDDEASRAATLAPRRRRATGDARARTRELGRVDVVTAIARDADADDGARGGAIAVRSDVGTARPSPVFDLDARDDDDDDGDDDGRAGARGRAATSRSDGTRGRRREGGARVVARAKEASGFEGWLEDALGSSVVNRAARGGSQWAAFESFNLKDGRRAFVKTSAKDPSMFAGEAAGLRALRGGGRVRRARGVRHGSAAGGESEAIVSSRWNI